MSAGPAALALALATLVGLGLGTAVPGLHVLQPLTLPLLFLQTLIAVGSLAERGGERTRRWVGPVLLRHHVVTSAPLLVLGLLLGLDTPLGAGTFLLGAVPPAIALPSSVAACGGKVRPAVHFTLVGYALGVVLTPALVLAGLGAADRLAPMALTLAVGLVLPAVLAVPLRPVLHRLSRRMGFTVIAVAVLVLMTGMGSLAREALQAAGSAGPAVLAGAAAIGLGRCVVGAVLGAWWAPGGRLRVEAALATGGKNAVLAGVVAAAVVGPVAALPALISLGGDVALLLVCSAIARRAGQSPPAATA